MLAVAAVTHRSTTAPLLLFGPGWIMIGAIGVWQGHRFVREIVVRAGVARFSSASACIELPATDITRVSHAWFDVHRMGTLTVNTASNGKIKAMGRLDGLSRVVEELRRSNPALLIRNV
jgi:hypothetical protein